MLLDRPERSGVRQAEHGRVDDGLEDVGSGLAAEGMAVPEAIIRRQSPPSQAEKRGPRGVYRKNTSGVADGCGRRVTRLSVVENSLGTRVNGSEDDHRRVLARRGVGTWLRLDRTRQPRVCV